MSSSPSPPLLTRRYLSWATDVECDDGSAGIDLNCPAHGCDGGACWVCGPDVAGEICTLGIVADEVAHITIRPPLSSPSSS